MNRRLALTLIAIAAAATISATLFVARKQARQLQPIELSLLWEPQAQFLGYYVAKDRGFFADEGLDVKITHSLAVGDALADVAANKNSYAVTNFINVLTWGGGPRVELVSIISPGCNLGWTVKGGKQNLNRVLTNGTLDSWWGSQDMLLRLLGKRLEISDKSLLGRIRSTRDPDLSSTTAILTMTYNEALKYTGPDVNHVSYCELGLPIFEDVLVGHQDQSTTRHRAVARAVWRGWDWALQHPEEALDSLMALRPSRPREFQQRQAQIFFHSLTPMSGRSELTEPAAATIKALIREQLIPDTDDVHRALDAIGSGRNLRCLPCQ